MQKDYLAVREICDTCGNWVLKGPKDITKTVRTISPSVNIRLKNFPLFRQYDFSNQTMYAGATYTYRCFRLSKTANHAAPCNTDV